MLLKIVYVLVRRLLSLAVLVFRGDLSRWKIGFGWRDRADVDVKFVNERLVGRSWRGWDPEPPQALTPRRPAVRITGLVFDGIRAC